MSGKISKANLIELVLDEQVHTIVRDCALLLVLPFAGVVKDNPVDGPIYWKRNVCALQSALVCSPAETTSTTKTFSLTGEEAEPGES
jgi:hypothetical protein